MAAVTKQAVAKNEFVVIEGGKLASKTDASSSLDALDHGKSIRQHIREFGALFGVVMCVIAFFQLRKPGGFEIACAMSVWGSALYILGVRAPSLLRPFWSGWMKFAHVLGFVMTSVLLVGMWVTLVIPLGIALRVFRVTVLDMTFRAPVATYWESRDSASNDFKLLERQW